jgi:hypothetical protein
MTTEELLRRECHDRRGLKLYVQDGKTTNNCIPARRTIRFYTGLNLAMKLTPRNAQRLSLSIGSIL